MLLVAFFAFDLGRYFDLEFLKERRGRLHGLFLARPVPRRRGLLCDLRRRHRALPARGGGPHPGRGRDLRARVGDRHRLLRVNPRRDRLPSSSPATSPGPRSGDGSRVRSSESTAGSGKDGAFYLFTLRLVPVFPFFIINLAMGLTSMRVLVFAFVSQAGMLPGTLVYVNAGTRLGELESLAGHPVAGAILVVLRPPRGLPPHRQEDRRCAPGLGGSTADTGGRNASIEISW